MRRDWRDDAACLGKDLAWFFPIGEADGDQRFEAKRVCATCTVREPCLDWAEQAGNTDGVFGGLDEAERRARRLRHRRRPINPRATDPTSETARAEPTKEDTAT